MLFVFPYALRKPSQRVCSPPSQSIFVLDSVPLNAPVIRVAEFLLDRVSNATQILLPPI